MGIHARSRHRELNSLTCLVMGLTGWKTTIELQNDAYVSGLITEVDAKMNIEVEDASYTDGNGKTTKLEMFSVRGRKIRYVHIPDQMDMLEVIKNRVTPRIMQKRTSTKSQIVQKRTDQTIRRFRRQQEEEMQHKQQQGQDMQHRQQQGLEMQYRQQPRQQGQGESCDRQGRAGPSRQEF